MWHELESTTLDMVNYIATQPPRMLVHGVWASAHYSIHCSFANAVI